MTEFERNMLDFWILQANSTNKSHAAYAKKMILEANKSARWQD